MTSQLGHNPVHETTTILVADDEAITRLRLKHFLEDEMGLHVLSAGDGDEAWQQFTQHDIRFVISDWMMPGCDGPELCQRIRQLAGRPYTYFILLTGRTEREDLVAGMSSGADDYVHKPVDYPELQSRVQAGLRVIELERALAGRNDELRSVNYALNTGLRAASQVQLRMLPDVAQLTALRKETNLALAFSYQSCETLGGDVLGVVRTSRDSAAVFIADVSGHGIPAALSAVSLHTFIQACVQQDPDPVALAERTNRYCCEEFPEQVYASLVYLHCYPREGRAQLLVAGHPPVIRYKGDKLIEAIDSQIPPLGLFADAAHNAQAHELELHAGERLLTYTDGVIETRNQQKQLFNVERLIVSALKASKHQLDDVPRAILADVARWRGKDLPAEDDITVVALECQCGDN